MNWGDVRRERMKTKINMKKVRQVYYDFMDDTPTLILWSVVVVLGMGVILGLMTLVKEVR